MRCVIICGSPEYNAGFLKQTVKEDDYVICADMGYAYAVNAGIKPDLIVGDFDSCKIKLPADIETIKLNTHKDDTDAMHCVCVAADKGFDEIILLAALGGRNDHSFANFCLLSYLCDRGVKARIESENEAVYFLKPGEYSFDNNKGKTFSVFPFGCDEINVSYLGDVAYPAFDLSLNLSVVQGISNIFNSDHVRIRVNKGTCLVFVEKNVQ